MWEFCSSACSGNGIVDVRSEMNICAQPEHPPTRDHFETYFEGDGRNNFDLLDPLLISNSTLIRHNNDVVSVETLRGKIVGLLFISLDPPWGYPNEEHLRCSILNLATAYNELSISNKNCFEIVFVAKGGRCKHYFDYYLKMMPWLALPFREYTLRDHLCSSAEIQCAGNYYLVLYDCHGQPLRESSRNVAMWFERCRADWYPFTTEKLNEILHNDYAIKNNKSLKKLLANRTRDFVIKANDGTHVPIDSLEDKVVGIFFCPAYAMRSHFTKKLVEVYEELKRKRNPFEVVMVYYEPVGYCWPVECPIQDLKSLPWLILPHTDSNCRMLMRIFEPTVDQYHDHDLIIMGPHASFINNHGFSTIENYGIEAYPFSRLCVAQRIKKRLEELRLESLLTCGVQNYVISANGKMISVSNLCGKMVFLLFPYNKIIAGELSEWYETLRQIYADIAVILVVRGAYGKSLFDDYHLQGSWFALPYNDYTDTLIDSLCKALDVSDCPTMSVFGPDGRLVRLHPFYSKGAARYRFTSSSQDLLTNVYGRIRARHMWPKEYNDK